MNKKELIGKVADKTGLSKKDVEASFTQIFETIKEALGQEMKIAIKGFGTFSVKKRAEKKGRHPKTGEELLISARSVPAFSAGSDLKEVVANPKKAGAKAPAKAEKKAAPAKKDAAKADKKAAPAKAEKKAAPAKAEKKAAPAKAEKKAAPARDKKPKK